MIENNCKEKTGIIKNIFTVRNVLKSIFVVIIIIESILLIILNIRSPQIHKIEETLSMHILTMMMIVIALLIIAIVIYIIEHNINNKNETIIEEEEIYPKFDTDAIKNNDIVLLSTILNQKYPNKKEIVLLLMQLINNGVIDLTMNFDGKKHQYFIEKRKYFSYTLNEAEEELIDYIFNNYPKVDLLKLIEKIYKDNGTKSILRKTRKYIEKELTVKESGLKFIYKAIICCISGILIYLSIMAFMMIDSFVTTFSTPIYIIMGILCIFINFLFVVVLNRIALKYQYDNDSFLWLSKIIVLYELIFIISYIFPIYVFIQYYLFSTFTLALLAIMIRYNTHITLTKRQVATKKELLSLKKYLLSMNYLVDKEFGNIINYEEYIMYGFLFNITIKINKEFDIIQKEIKECVDAESKSYWNMLKEII